MTNIRTLGALIKWRFLSLLDTSRYIACYGLFHCMKQTVTPRETNSALWDNCTYTCLLITNQYDFRLYK